jgi:hypothetical protein
MPQCVVPRRAPARCRPSSTPHLQHRTDVPTAGWGGGYLVVADIRIVDLCVQCCLAPQVFCTHIYRPRPECNTISPLYQFHLSTWYHEIRVSDSRSNLVLFLVAPLRAANRPPCRNCSTAPTFQLRGGGGGYIW